MTVKKGFSLKQVKRNNIIILFVVLLFTLLSCQKGKMDEDKLVRIYVENLIIEETYISNPDSLIIKKEILYKKFNTTKENFEKELIKLGSDREKWEGFFNKSRALLEDLRKSGAIS